MGTRSDVAISMREEDYNILKERASQLGDELKEVSYLLEGARIAVTNKGVAILKWNDVKWNYSPEITWIENFLDELEENDKPYSFVLVGEDRNDNEETIFKGVDGDKEECDVIWLERKIETYI